MTPEQALQALTQLSRLPNVKLSFDEHVVIQQALQVLSQVVTAATSAAPAEEAGPQPEAPGGEEK